MIEKEIIDQLGVRNVARACGVEAPTVWKWKIAGLPSEKNYGPRRAAYERVLARMLGIKVAELREMIRRDREQNQMAEEA